MTRINEKELSNEMRKFIIKESMDNELDPIKDKSKFNKIVNEISRELKKGKGVTTVVNGELVVIEMVNDNITISKR